MKLVLNVAGKFKLRKVKKAESFMFVKTIKVENVIIFLGTSHQKREQNLMRKKRLQRLERRKKRSN